jgi:glycosyltransferase involved in cell wall biosynthesis
MKARPGIAMIGTRGVPATYGGFETAVEEIGCRLVESGFPVTVYTRDRAGAQGTYRGMSLVYARSVRSKSLETLTHTALTVVSNAIGSADVGFVFNAANAPFLPLLRRRGLRCALHVDGLEWQRAKWGPLGRRYYRAAERLAVRWADALICDSRAIGDYYEHKFAVRPRFIPYGAPLLERTSATRLEELNLEPGRYHLVVARMEPENNVHIAVEAHLLSQARFPLVVVGSAPYVGPYQRELERLASLSDDVRLVGSVWDQALLDELYAHSATYIHGHSVGGTNPSLLRAMGAGANVLAFDVAYSREVLGPAGRYYRFASDLPAMLAHAEESGETSTYGREARTRAALRYRWDEVADAYGQLALELAGRSAA